MSSPVVNSGFNLSNMFLRSLLKNKSNFNRVITIYICFYSEKRKNGDNGSLLPHLASTIWLFFSTRPILHKLFIRKLNLSLTMCFILTICCGIINL